jgi:hypothetical protein
MEAGKERLKAPRLFIAGLFLSAIVFVAYATVTNYFQIIPIQILLAISWSCLFTGTLIMLLQDNKERATSTGILFPTVNFSQVTGMFLKRFMAQLCDYEPLIYVAAGLYLAGYGVLKEQARQKNSSIPRHTAQTQA